MSSGAPATTAGQMHHVIREALDAFAAPDVRERILARALFVAGLTAIPESGPALAEFVDRFLRQAMEASLDEHSAELAVQGLAPIVRLAAERIEPEPEAPKLDEASLWDSPLELPRFDERRHRLGAPRSKPLSGASRTLRCASQGSRERGKHHADRHSRGTTTR